MKLEMKGILKILFGFALVLGLMYGMNVNALAVDVNNWSELKQAVNNSYDITLKGDMKSDAPLTIPSNRQITIDLNGFTIDRGLSTSQTPSPTDGGNVITVQNQSELIIVDSSSKQSGKITGGYNTGGGGGVLVENGGTFELAGGNICNNMATYTGAGVSNWGTFEMTGGTISSNKTTPPANENGRGGGVWNGPNSKFTMTGGTIKENTAKQGGGVYNGPGSTQKDHGVFIMLGDAEISKNQAEEGGGGVWNDGKFAMYGISTITKNSSKKGGGVYNGDKTSNHNPGIFSLSGSAVIKKNEADEGGGVWNQGKFIMDDDSKITKNEAKDDRYGFGGGGVYNEKYGTFTLSSGNINRNLSAARGGGVADYGVFNMTGGMIKGNASKYEGGGVAVIGEFNMSGNAKIKNNNMIGLGNGGGVHVESLSTFKLSGSVEISGNKDRDDKDDNVVLKYNDSTIKAVITVDGSLTNSVPIGVGYSGNSIPDSVEFTKGFKGSDPAKIFTSEMDGYSIFLNAENGEAVLAKPVTVTFDKNSSSATGTMSDHSAPKNIQTRLPANKYTWSRHIFTGWNTQADGKGTSYADEGKIKVTGNTTLYAQWEVNKSGVTPPRAKTLTYTGSPQELVYAGSSPDGVMYYAVTTENKAPTDESLYTTSIPTGTNAGTYYVWYKVKGDNNHTDTEPACIQVTIGENPQQPASGESAQSKSTNKIRINAGLKFNQSGSAITAKWGKVPNANLYEVYGSYCDKKPKLQKTVKGSKNTKITIKKLNGKKLNLKKCYKFYVVAYKKANGKKTRLAKSLSVHIVGRKNGESTNPKAIKLKKKSYTLTRGKTARIKAKLVLADKKKKPLSKKHGPVFRYASSNKAVATVTKGGKIKGKKVGSCTVYVYAINGYAKKIRVTVK